MSDWWLQDQVVTPVGSAAAPNWWSADKVVGGKPQNEDYTDAELAARGLTRDDVKYLAPKSVLTQQASGSVPTGNGPEAPQTATSPGAVYAYGHFIDPGNAKTINQLARQGMVKSEAADDNTAGLTRSAAQGATFGFGDEMAAALRSTFKNEDYGNALNDERAKLDAYREANPVKAYGTELAAGLAAPIGVAGDMLKGGVTAGKLLKSGAVVGGGTGALYGFGSGQDGVVNRLAEALEGAGKGAVVGTVLPQVVNAGVRVGGSVASAVRNVVNPKGAAIRDIADALSQAKLDPSADIAPHMGPGQNNSGVNLNMVDAAREAALQQDRAGASRPVSELARDATGIGGDASAAAGEALEGRQANQSARLNKVFSEAANGADYGQEVARLDAIIDNQARQAYGNAFKTEQPFDVVTPLTAYAKQNEDLLKTNSDLGNGIRKALSLFTQREAPAVAGNAPQLPASGATITAQSYNALIKQMEAAASPKAQGGEAIANLRQYQAVRDSLDQMIQKSMNAGEPTKLTGKLTALRNVADQAVKTPNPEFAHADRIFSGAKTAQDLLQAGQKTNVFTAGPAQDEILQHFAMMTPEQQEAFRIGITRNMQNRVNNPNADSTKLAKQFNTASAHNFINQIFPPDRARRLLSELSRETSGTRSFTDVFSNSRTAPMSHGMQGLTQDANIAANVASLNPGGTLHSVAQKLARAFTGEKANETVRMLADTNPQAVQPIIDAVAKRTAKSGQLSDRYQALAAALAGASARVPVQQYSPPPTNNKTVSALAQALQGQ